MVLSEEVRFESFIYIYYIFLCVCVRVCEREGEEGDLPLFLSPYVYGGMGIWVSPGKTM